MREAERRAADRGRTDDAAPRGTLWIARTGGGGVAARSFGTRPAGGRPTSLEGRRRRGHGALRWRHGPAAIAPAAGARGGRHRGRVRAAGPDVRGLRSEINVAVVETGNDVILIDTGGGPDYMPTVGKLSGRLEAAGIKPEAK